MPLANFTVFDYSARNTAIRVVRAGSSNCLLDSIIMLFDLLRGTHQTWYDCKVVSEKRCRVQG